MDFGVLGFSALRELKDYHPLLSHFAVALVPSAFCFYLIGIAVRSERFCFAGRVTLWLGLAGAALSTWSGMQAEGRLPGQGERLRSVMELHEAGAWILLALVLVLAVWSLAAVERRPRSPWLFLLVLAFAGLMALQSGDIGQRLVYIEGAGVRGRAQAPADIRPAEPLPQAAQPGTEVRRTPAPQRGTPPPLLQGRGEAHTPFATD